MDGRCVASCQRMRHFNRHLLVRHHHRRYLDIRLQWLRGIDGVVGLLVFLFLLLLLLPFLYLIGQILLAFLVGCLSQHIEGISLTDEIAQGVGHHIAHLHAQRILVHEHRVPQPVVDGVLLLVGLNDEGRVGFKVQALDLWQIRMPIAEKHRDLLRILPLCLEQIAIRLNVGESQEGDVIGQEVSIGRWAQGIDMQRVAPDGVDTGIRFRRGFNGHVVKGHHLSTLREVEIIVHVLQRKGPIGAWGDTLYHETTPAVGT